jgi:hypothetical protein
LSIILDFKTGAHRKRLVDLLWLSSIARDAGGCADSILPPSAGSP